MRYILFAQNENVFRIDTLNGDTWILETGRWKKIEEPAGHEIPQPQIILQRTPIGNSPFDLFWNAYPRKVGKGAAEKAWAKIELTVDLIKKIMDSVESQSKTPDWIKDGGQYIPHPATWLNQRRWEDEIKISNQEAYDWRELPIPKK